MSHAVPNGLTMINMKYICEFKVAEHEKKPEENMSLLGTGGCTVRNIDTLLHSSNYDKKKHIGAGR